MSTHTDGPEAIGLFQGLESPGARRLPETLILDEDRDTTVFEGQMLQEVATAVENAKEPRDPQSVFAALMTGVEEGRALSGNLAGPGPLAHVLQGEVMLGVPGVVKQAFDFYFRDDLYGEQIHRDPIILSSGSFDESVFGLPASLKDCIRYALDRNWYGYSHSLGRASAREALARLESARSDGPGVYDFDCVGVTLGGTATLSSLVDLLVERAGPNPRAVACIPNYPPLVAGMARRLPTQLVPTPLVGGRICIEPLLEALRSDPTVALMQTVVNPWGRRIAEDDVERVVAALPKGCYLILDECHDTVGPRTTLTPARRHERVISLRSLSKRWAAPGLKVGWILGDKSFLDDFYHHASTTYGGPGSLLYLLLEMFALFETARLTGSGLSEHQGYLLSQYAVTPGRLASALDDYLASAARMTELVTSRRVRATERLRAAGIPVLAAHYSINICARLGDLPSYQLYRRLVTEARVSVLPGLLTMGDCHGLARLSPCLDEAVLDEGLERLIAWHQMQC